MQIYDDHINDNNQLFVLSLCTFKLNFSHYFAFLTSLSVAICFTFLPIDIFKDRYNYFDYAQRSFDILTSYFSKSLLIGFTNEPLWLLLNTFLSYFLTPESVVRVIIFFPALVIITFVFTSRPKYIFLFLFFMLNSSSLANHIHHLRFSLALSLLFLALCVSNSYLRLLILLITPFIHSAFFVIITMFFCSCLIFKYRHHFIILVFLGLFFLLLFALLYYVSDFSVHMHGPRQVSRYTSLQARVGGGGFVMWGFFLLLFLSEGKDFIFKHLFEIFFMFLYLSMYFFIPGAKRFIEAGIWFIILAALTLPLFKRYLFIISFGSYTALELYFLSSSPWLGMTYE